MGRTTIRLQCLLNLLCIRMLCLAFGTHKRVECFAALKPRRAFLEMRVKRRRSGTWSKHDALDDASNQVRRMVGPPAGKPPHVAWQTLADLESMRRGGVMP